MQSTPPITRALLLLSMLLSTVTIAAEPEEVVVAARGDAKVTLQDLDAYVMAVPKHLRAGLLDDPERIEMVIQNLLLNRQLANWARERGAEGHAYHEILVRQAIEDHLAKRAKAIHEDEVMAELPDFEQLAREIFISHPHRFRTPPMLELEHVLVRLDPRNEAASRERVQKAREELMNPDADFAKIFSEFSDEAIDGSGTATGKLGNVVPGMMEKPFEEAAFKLTRAGEVSDIIQTRYGLHVVRLVSRRESTQIEWEDVRDQLVQEQRQSYVLKEKSRLLQQMNSLPLEASQPVVAQLRTRYEKADQGVLPPPVDGSEPQAEAGSDGTGDE